MHRRAPLAGCAPCPISIWLPAPPRPARADMGLHSSYSYQPIEALAQYCARDAPKSSKVHVGAPPKTLARTKEDTTEPSLPDSTIRAVSEEGSPPQVATQAPHLAVSCSARSLPLPPSKTAQCCQCLGHV
ncbi:hypothetical protein VDBG_02759 [Verticillium alfalfae VaMs.102]|uniref:Uncharacterized protein n=1 Tax=Verticillium alfalfae (strain VaMs.102 / ATCC MYA-4576 / FGSC 10136) TaxID=526221 RepID=C9SEQ7_VERA1|nr:hypothetical protein VDBG_02759 [Verticillium alfalfae VaMs.102]EEY16650.1 hypothetical protein VDBG_02759 [Verticillium alfalfae VaMs.102]